MEPEDPALRAEVDAEVEAETRAAHATDSSVRASSAGGGSRDLEASAGASDDDDDDDASDGTDDFDAARAAALAKSKRVLTPFGKKLVAHFVALLSLMVMLGATCDFASHEDCTSGCGFLIFVGLIFSFFTLALFMVNLITLLRGMSRATGFTYRAEMIVQGIIIFWLISAVATTSNYTDNTTWVGVVASWTAFFASWYATFKAWHMQQEMDHAEAMMNEALYHDEDRKKIQKKLLHREESSEEEDEETME